MSFNYVSLGYKKDGRWVAVENRWSFSTELLIETVQTSSSYEESLEKLVGLLRSHLAKEVTWLIETGRQKTYRYKELTSLPSRLSGLSKTLEQISESQNIDGWDISNIKSRATKLRKRGIDLKYLKDYKDDAYATTQQSYNSYLKNLANYHALSAKIT